MTEQLVTLSETDRLSIRQACLKSLFYLAKNVLGYRDLSSRLHVEVTAFTEQTHRRKLIVLPRGHLKTTICTKAYAIWRYLRDPDIRILIANEKAENAQHMLREIKHHFEANELFQWLFPEYVPDLKTTKWTESEALCPRSARWQESTFETIGVGGTVVSRHYNLIVMDDLVGKEATKSQQVMQDTIEWFRYARGLMVKPAESELIVVGNRWAFSDLVSHILDSGANWVTLKRAVMEGGEPIWPEWYPPEAIDEILEDQGAHIFSCQYMNDPVHESPSSFNPTWFRFFTKLPSALQCVTAIDPAISQQKHGDFSAIITIGADPDRSLFVVDARRGRWGIDELIDHIFEVYRIWRPLAVGLETAIFQKALLWPIREAMRREDTYIPMRELRPSSKISKEARIKALHEYFASGTIWLQESQRELLVELRQFPLGKHDDLLDALAYSVQMALYPSKAVEPARVNPLSFEALETELNLKRTLPGPWIWHGPQPQPVLGAHAVPQTHGEIQSYMHEGPYSHE